MNLSLRRLDQQCPAEKELKSLTMAILLRLGARSRCQERKVATRVERIGQTSSKERRLNAASAERWQRRRTTELREPSIKP
jgi:hypothetical protein